MSFQNPRAFLSPDFIIRAAAQPWELRGVEELRHQVFVQEQGIFADHDRDGIDDHALPLAAISTLASEADQVVGTVRIHEEAPRLWRGSRLAVARSHRRMGRLGAELIQLAVCTAHGRGCDRFLAQVQMQNVPLFKRLHWVPLREIEVHGVPHMEMQADLAAYPPIPDPFVGWKALSPRRRRVR
ncbi:MSMEG_0567/Sll0786 family nitrogen starvation N-acetyltransferase [Epibacterium ulvae]|uniref:Putative N-acetyltransferase, MSMEG_0567 N-terminal domain family n=1 Tax=Epibacterium ulvae TaxID=1156985 RepID=A0A1G5R3I1_9RHOB|nr:MSMEG_0567/Sll0786 family nitrogen starvation N-acetyltransferase [Epibacterium ulvae]SCZ67889.1 putative N-acetyltransferase, MSMEG_0567 N-terminal domain family [Epibacterium ulvae]